MFNPNPEPIHHILIRMYDTTQQKKQSKVFRKICSRLLGGDNALVTLKEDEEERSLGRIRAIDVIEERARHGRTRRVPITVEEERVSHVSQSPWCGLKLFTSDLNTCCIMYLFA